MDSRCPLDFCAGCVAGASAPPTTLGEDNERPAENDERQSPGVQPETCANAVRPGGCRQDFVVRPYVWTRWAAMVGSMPCAFGSDIAVTRLTWSSTRCCLHRIHPLWCWRGRLTWCTAPTGHKLARGSGLGGGLGNRRVHMLFHGGGSRYHPHM